MVSTRRVSLNEFRSITERHTNWGRWGKSDQLGTLNFITPEVIRSASKEIRRGVSFSLAISLDSYGPQRGMVGRFNPILLMTRDGGDAMTGAYSKDWLAGAEKETSTADEVVVMPTQCATHWDSLAHVMHKGKMYNDQSAAEISSTGAKRNGIYSSRQSIIGRGILLDIAALKGRPLKPGEGITDILLEKALRRENLRVNEGDIVLVRTGHMAEARKRGGWGDYTGGPAPGLSVDALHWLWENKVGALASDTWGLEVQPFEVEEVHLPFHVVSLVYMGLTLGEIFDLEALSVDCAADGVFSFFLAAQPLPFTKAVASPVNPIAIK